VSGKLFAVKLVVAAPTASPRGVAAALRGEAGLLGCVAMRHPNLVRRAKLSFTPARQASLVRQTSVWPLSAALDQSWALPTDPHA
jgi:hypothetical protein